MIGYASEWGPYYISLFSVGRLEPIGYLQQFEHPCEDKKIANIECKSIYRIPQKLFGSGIRPEAIGLGVLLHAVDISCANGFGGHTKFGNIEDAGKNLDGLNLYRTISLTELNCEGDILVKVWSPDNYRRFGHIGAPAVVGSSYEVERVKKFVEFFRSQLLLILAALFFGIFLFNQIIFRMVKFNFALSPMEQYFDAWLGFMFFFSGAASTLFPLNSSSYFFTRISNFFILIAYFGLTVHGIGRSRKLSAYLTKFARILTDPNRILGRFQLLHLVALVFVLSPNYAKGLGPVYLTMSIITFAFGALEQSSLYLGFGFVGILCGLKLFMIPYMPEGYAVMVFALACITDAFVARVKKSAHLTETMRWSRDLVESFHDSKTIADLLQEFGTRFEIKQITLVMAQSKGGCEISVHRFRNGKWNTEVFFRNLLPPTISHVLTTRQPLWHVEQDSLLALNIRKGNPSTQNYASSHYTVVPLLNDHGVIGAISFTDYDANLCKDEFEKLELSTTVNHLFSFIAQAAANQSSSANEGWDHACIAVAEKISELKNVPTIGGPNVQLSMITSLIASELQVGVFIGRLDPVSRKVELHSIAGYNEEAETAYKQTQFYAVSHNEQGPIALAINRGQIVSVGDVGLIASVLHAISIKVFAIAGTKSCAAIPISGEGSSLSENGFVNSKDAWGVIWLESKEIGRFSPRSESGLKMIQSAIETLLLHGQVMETTSRATLALAGFVPDHVLPRLLRGQSVREEEEGYLLMADLLESTQLSRQIGADAWHEFISQTSPTIKAIAVKYGFTLQAVVWDAFYFTRGCRSRYSEIVNTIEFSEELLIAFGKAIASIPGYAGEKAKQRARFCLTYGDITRDAKLAFTHHWTIVGASMAMVHKLEQACKGISGWFYVSESAVQSDPGPMWTLLDQSVKGTGEKIYSYEAAARVPSEAELDETPEVENKHAA